MNDNSIDFNTKLKKISKDLVASFLKNNDSPRDNQIKENNDESNQSSKNFEQNYSSCFEIINTNNKDFPLISSENKSSINNNIPSSQKGLLFTEQTTKSSVSNNNIPNSAKIKVSSIKAKTNNKINSHKNRYSFDLNKTFSSSTTYTNFMAKQESIREKKNFLEKIQYLRNHIKALKKHQSEIAKKEEKIKEKESYKNTVKKQKESIRQALLSAEIDKRNEMEQKRKKIAEIKTNETKRIKIAQGKIKNDKLKKYKNALIQKRKCVETINKDTKKLVELNKTQIVKIKNERENNKKLIDIKRKKHINKINKSYRLAYQTNLNETKKLKNELTRLEKLEEEYLGNLDISRDSIMKSHIDIRRKLNDEDKKENNRIIIVKKNANSVGKRYKINNSNNNLSIDKRVKNNC